MSDLLLNGGVGLLKRRKTVGTTNIPTDKQAYDICCAFSFVLDKLYPGYLWQVGMNQDMVFIQNMSLNKVLGYKLPLKDFDAEGKVLLRIGGEILERHGMKRGKRVQADFKALKRDIQHNAKPEL